MMSNPPEDDTHQPPTAARPLSVWLATGLGVGLVAPAPGTFGALWGLLLAWTVTMLPGFGWQLGLIVVLNLVGVPLCTAAGRALGGKKDHQAIIWDELATVPVVFLLVPMTGFAVALVGFGLHRLFDITKPPPARQAERLPDGLGVMADDWVAGLYGAAALGALAWIDQAAGWNLLSASSG